MESVGKTHAKAPSKNQYALQRVFDVQRMILHQGKRFESLRNLMVVDFRLGQIMFQEAHESKQIVFAVPISQLRTVSVDQRGTGLIRFTIEDSREYVTDLFIRILDVTKQLDFLIWLQHHFGTIFWRSRSAQSLPTPTNKLVEKPSELTDERKDDELEKPLKSIRR